MIEILFITAVSIPIIVSGLLIIMMLFSIIDHNYPMVQETRFRYPVIVEMIFDDGTIFISNDDIFKEGFFLRVNKSKNLQVGDTICIRKIGLFWEMVE